MSTTLDLPKTPSSVVSEVATAPQETVSPASTDKSNIENAKIAIIDDEPYMIAVVRKYLQTAGYKNFITTTNSSKALQMISSENPDLLLLDIMMPEISGLDILRVLQMDEKHQRMPVLILTAASKAETMQQALELGATDFLAKPVDANELLPRIRNTLITKAYQDRLASHAEQLEGLVRQRTAELEAAQEEIVHCLARAAEYRDDETGRHVMRVGRYAALIARNLDFDERQVKLLELAAQLHDIGKIAIPDEILGKPGKLTPDEFSFIQRHCATARKIMQPMPEAEWKTLQNHPRLGAELLKLRTSPLLQLASRIAQTHHEWWDGSGYPLGLAGEDILLEGRITAIADVYDALSTARPYKKAMPREKCFEIMAEERGTHFDPHLLDVFFSCADEIVRVQMECMDLD
jgi:putative two-component system response regulator